MYFLIYLILIQEDQGLHGCGDRGGGRERVVPDIADQAAHDQRGSEVVRVVYLHADVHSLTRFALRVVVDDVLEGDDFTLHHPVSGIALAVTCVVHADQLVPSWVHFGYLGCMLNGSQYMSFIGVTI